MTLEFDEENYEKARRYEVPFLVRAAAVKNIKGRVQVRKGSFSLSIGGRQIDAQAQCLSKTDIVRDDIGGVISRRYYREAMEEIVKDTYHQSIYLARIGVIKAGTTFVIDGIEQMPFNQYVCNEVLAGVMNRVTEEKIKKLERSVLDR